MIRIELPSDVRKIVLVRQAEIKCEKKIRSYSQQQTIFNIIKEWKELKDTKKQS